MITFLFWNLGEKLLEERLARIAHSYGVDVILLAECKVQPSVMLETLNQQADSKFHLCPGLCDKIAVFARFGGEFIAPYFETCSFRFFGLLDH